MIIVTGTAKLAPGEIERLMPVLEAQMAGSQAEEGCMQYDFSCHVSDPDTLIITERWVDQAALDAHFTMPHMAEFNAALGTAKLLGVNVVEYQISSSRQLMGG